MRPLLLKRLPFIRQQSRHLIWIMVGLECRLSIDLTLLQGSRLNTLHPVINNHSTANKAKITAMNSTNVPPCLDHQDFSNCNTLKLSMPRFQKKTASFWKTLRSVTIVYLSSICRYLSQYNIYQLVLKVYDFPNWDIMKNGNHVSSIHTK